MNDFRANNNVASCLSSGISSSNVAPKSNSTLLQMIPSDPVAINGEFTKKKTTAILLPTIRFELKLEKPSSEYFPEFNYNKLVLKSLKALKKKSKKAKPEEGETKTGSISIDKEDLSILDKRFNIEKDRIKELLSTIRKKIVLDTELDENENLEANDEETNELEIEERRKRKKKPSSVYDPAGIKFKYKDFNYLGQGYDENDSFIDNTDATDEKVPANMAPKKGGFYINKGNLKLEKISEKKKGKRNGENEEKSDEDDVVQINDDDEDENEDKDYEEDSEDEESESSDDDDESDEEDTDDEETDEEDEEEDDEVEEGEVKKPTIEIPVIEVISSNTNSNASAATAMPVRKKRVRRLIEDGEEGEEPGVVKGGLEDKKTGEKTNLPSNDDINEETIKENIDNNMKNTVPSTQPVNLSSHTANIKKRRKEEMSGTVVTSAVPAKLTRTEIEIDANLKNDLLNVI